MPYSAPVKKVYPLLASVLATLAIAIFLLAIFAGYVRHLQDSLSTDMFNIMSEAADDVYSALTPLNDYAFTSCNEDNLRIMETALFNGTFAKQIMFYQDDVGVCSTGSGIMATPVRRPPPDFISAITGAEIWVNRQFILDLTGEPINAIIIKLGNYSVLTQPDIFTIRPGTPFEWQFLFRDPHNRENFAHISGSQGIYQINSREAQSDNASIFYYEACDTTRPYLCLVLTTTANRLISQYPETFVMLVIISLLLGNFTGYRVNNTLISYQTINARALRGFTNDAYYWLYQPIIDMENGQLVGCEVLSRFRDRYGVALPDTYLPVLREKELTARFTQLMFRKVLDDMYQTPGLPDGFKVSMNIFPADIVSGAIDAIVAIPELNNSRFEICLEVTEEEYLDEISSKKSLENLQASGLSIAIDDFGTGYSNLKQLKNLNCTYLKIDSSYIADLEAEPIRASLIPHIISIADQLGMTVIAEGIETFEQQVILVGMGIRYGQGDYFGTPMPSAKLANLRNTGNVPEAVIMDS